MSESIGARLREAREKRQLSLQQASDTTKVRTHYLQALENDDLSAMPSVAQARGFLRIYAEFLGLQVADLVPPAPPASAVAPVAGPPSYVEPKAAPEPGTGAASKAPRPGLLDNVRQLLARRGKPEASSTVASSAVETETTGNGSAPGEPTDGTLTSAKKKRKKKRAAH